MIFEAILALLLLGTRCVMAKYCAKMISAFSLVRYNFYTIGSCGLIVLLLSLTGIIEAQAQAYSDPYLLKVNLASACFFIFADMFAMLALSKGLTGPASAILCF